MDEITLQLGKGSKPTTFHKSSSEIAIRPRQNLSAAERAALHPQLRFGQTKQPGSLAGFQLLSVPATEMEAELDVLRNDPAVAAGTHVYHTSDDEVPFVPTGEIYVKWSDRATPAECNALLEEHHLTVQELRGGGAVVLRITEESPNPLKVAAELQKSRAVEVAEPDLATPGTLHAFVLPSEPFLDRQWHLRNTGSNGGSSLGLTPGADARVIDAWELAGSFGVPEVVVAVIDDGFDLGHPDLSGQGKQIAPWDFTRRNDDPSPSYGFDENGRFFGDWHGTACAGVAVGTNQGTGIVGAAPGCRLMPVRWGPNLAASQVEAWFQYVASQGAAVVSCSWSAQARNFPLMERIADAITACARDGRGGLGTVICFAAGNENRDINDPSMDSINGFAIHPEVIAVAASTSMDKKANYSNYGDAISICAPSSGAGGRGILTADVRSSVNTPQGRFSLGYSADDFTADFGGTSSSTPLVAGICGLLLSLRPQATAQEIRRLLERTARKIGPASSYDASGHSRIFGYGCVDAYAAVQALLNGEEVEADSVGINPLWGKKGHETTNAKAIAALPETLRAFYSEHEEEIVAKAMAADHAKRNDPSEGPRHYLDADRYGPDPFAELPENFDEAVAKFGLETLTENGLLPWIIDDRFGKLVAAFESKHAAGIVLHSAWLGHYIGDSHVPLHTTENHDGNLTAQKGLHKYFETTVLNYIEPDEIVPPLGARFTKSILTLAFEWIRESHRHIPEILRADLETRRPGPQRRRDTAAFAERVRPIAIERLTRGATRLASAWLTAWDMAGKPALSGVIEAVPSKVKARKTTQRTPRPKALNPR